MTIIHATKDIVKTVEADGHEFKIAHKANRKDCTVQYQCSKFGEVFQPTVLQRYGRTIQLKRHLVPSGLNVGKVMLEGDTDYLQYITD